MKIEISWRQNWRKKIYTENLTEKLKKTETKIHANPGLALSCFEQLGPDVYITLRGRTSLLIV